MNWRQETYKSVLQRGEVDIGAIYPPAAGGRMWRWRIWVTVSGHPNGGRDINEAKVKAHLERRFQAFMDAARLIPAGGDA